MAHRHERSEKSNMLYDHNMEHLMFGPRIQQKPWGGFIGVGVFIGEFTVFLNAYLKYVLT